MDAVIIRKIELPDGVNGITVLDANGDYNIYLNDQLSPDSQAKAFRHEVEHIKQGHFFVYEELEVIDSQAVNV